MCLSQGVNEKLCTFSFNVLVTDYSHLPTPSRLPLHLLLFLLLSTSSESICPEGRVITGPVDSVALGFQSLLSQPHSLIKQVNPIHQTGFYNYLICKCRVLSHFFFSLSVKLRNLIKKYQHKMHAFQFRYTK